MREEQYKNIRIILGKDANEKEVRRIVKRIWQNWGRYLLDFFRLSRLDKNNLNTFVSEIKGREIIERALKRGGGYYYNSPSGTLGTRRPVSAINRF